MDQSYHENQTQIFHNGVLEGIFVKLVGGVGGRLIGRSHSLLNEDIVDETVDCGGSDAGRGPGPKNDPRRSEDLKCVQHLEGLDYNEEEEKKRKSGQSVVMASKTATAAESDWSDVGVAAQPCLLSALPPDKYLIQFNLCSPRFISALSTLGTN
jgi:hypothetical protein